MKPIYERLLQESSRAYLAFEDYRDMGAERSIQKVGKRLGKNPVALARLSKKYRWVERVKAYDAHISQKKCGAILKDIIKMERRHAEYAMQYQEVASHILKSLNDKLRYPLGADGSIGAFIRFAERYPKACKEIIEIERNARGLEKDKAGFFIVREDIRTTELKPDAQESPEMFPAKEVDETA